MRWILFLVVFAAVMSCSSAPADQFIARFRDREVDLEPFLLGFPYGEAEADLEFGHLLYFDTQPEGRWLRILALDGTGTVDLATGRKVGDTDWSTRSWGHCEYHVPTDRFYVTSDEANGERLNVYAMDPGDGRIEPITSGDYLYGWSFSEDQSLLAYLTRAGRQEPFNACLHIRDLETGEDRRILCDEGGADRFTWSALLFTPAKDRVILTVQHDGDRRLVSLAQVRLDQGDFDYLIPPRVMRRGIDILCDWVSDTEFLYQSSESGFNNLYLCDLDTRCARQITHYRESIRSPRLLETHPPLLVVAIQRPHETEIHLVDVRSGEICYREVMDASVKIIDTHGNRGIFSINRLTTPLRLEWFVARPNGEGWALERSLLSAMPRDLERQIIHCEPERITYPTFDGRRLHAFYLEPRRPPGDPSQRLVLITSFYGGGNYYGEKTHILGAVGIASMSPAPRGSWGFGAEFAALNDRDLGGDEIIDIFYAAHWLVEEKGYEPRQIGVHGGSHGGYATLRALTFPPETNGRDEGFDFGFGMSHAGFFDILTFYESCNIPDWVILEAGDPETERAKLMDRSPINHVERLRAPVFLTHGENDWRVPVTESRRLVERARALGRPVTYLEFPGQGHGIRGLPNTLTYYQGVFDFLESLDSR